ncbi:putative phosphoribulokinase/uridine kinase [Haematococcus lacustris]
MQHSNPRPSNMRSYHCLRSVQKQYWRRGQRLPPLQGQRKNCSASQVLASTPGQLQLQGLTYQDITKQLAQRVLQLLARQAEGRRMVVGLAGAPGSGKSTLARCVVEAVNAQQGAQVAALLPMDGFHYYRRELDAMPDPQAAHARRGAAWTFDATAFVASVRRAREEASLPLAVPSFDHGVGDPVPGDIWLQPFHRVVVVEGNYCLLDSPPWCELQQMWDETWFADIDLDLAMERVFRRQVALGVLADVSLRRIQSNDRPNGELVLTSRPRAAVLVPTSVPFETELHNA